MTERPLLMQGWSVRQILAGRKVETRRLRGLAQFNQAPHEWKVIRPMRQHERLLGGGTTSFPGRDVLSWIALKDPRGISDRAYQPIRCPFGMIGDRLWVRETTIKVEDHGYVGPVYAASKEGREVLEYGLRPDPNDMCEVEPDEIRFRPSIFMPRRYCRLVLEITALRCERLRRITAAGARAEGMPEVATVGKFRVTWDELNPHMDWDFNPWVWVISFRVVTAP